MKTFRTFITVFLGILIFAQPVFAATYAVDKDHTSVSFKIRHILSRVQGQFRGFEGSFDYDPEKPDTWKVNATVQTSSIDTGVGKRDEHLRSADFFEVEKYPALTFKSTEVTDVTPDHAKLHGLLAIHGVEKPVVFDLEILGTAKDPWGNVHASFTATTKINRKDFGLNWNQVLEAGQVLVGEEVEITLDVEGTRSEKATASGTAQ